VKKVKLLFISVLAVFLTGCVDVAIDMDIKNNDTGKVIYSIAYNEELFQDEESGFDVSGPEEIEEDWAEENVVISDLNYKKNEDTYVGKKIEFSFSSIDELNEYMNKVSNGNEEDSETTETKPIIFTRDGDNVKISMIVDSESADEMEYYESFIDYDVSIKLEGNVVEHNATNFNEETNTLTWNFKTLTEDGINVTYDTSVKTLSDEASNESSTDLIYYITMGVGLVVLGFVMYNAIKKVRQLNSV